MNPCSATYENLAEDFRDRISFDSPGFCDDPWFFEVERSDPHYLFHYAAGPYNPKSKNSQGSACGRLPADLVGLQSFLGMPGVLCYAKF